MHTHTVQRRNAHCCDFGVRRGIINLVLIGFILGSAYDIVADQEHWPFSQYPMFSGTWRSSTFTWLRLFGVTADGREFPLNENRYVSPFDQSRLPKALRQMLQKPDGPARVRTALSDLFARYEELRNDEWHDGPRIVAMRLYELEWTIQPNARNLDRPDRRELVAEVRR
jgi:hypothetical protein